MFLIPKSIPNPFVFVLTIGMISSTSITSDKKYLSAILVIVPLLIFAFSGIYPYSLSLTNFKVGIFILCL